MVLNILERSGQIQIDDIVIALRAQGYRITKARESIIKVLCVGGHYTVDDVIKELKKEYDDVNVATVYNNINFLVKEGIVNECNFNSKNSVFELNIGLHAHLVCLDCDDVKNINVPEFIDIKNKVQNEYGFDIVNAKLDIYGKCNSCDFSNNEFKK